MSASLFIAVYSNGDVWTTNDLAFVPGVRNESSQPVGTEAGTLVKWFRVNSDAKAQKVTTLTGSGNSSASALAASGGSATKTSAVELT